ncbi:MAG: hypothetical protein FWE88_09470 [Phycisphaerae bacterium]|nr:hypothetical protein [Phycisphaerae bacterium]
MAIRETTTVLLALVAVALLAGCSVSYQTTKRACHDQAGCVRHAPTGCVSERAALVGEWVCQQDREDRLTALPNMPQLPAILQLYADGTGRFMFWETDRELEGYEVNKWFVTNGGLSITGDRTTLYYYTRDGDTLTFTGAERKDDAYRQTGKILIVRNNPDNAITYKKVVE